MPTAAPSSRQAPYDNAPVQDVQVAERFPNARGVLVTAGQEGASYSFRSPTKAEHSGVVPAFDVGDCRRWGVHVL